METLATYRARVRRLLHDATGSYWSDADLLTDINDAIAQRDLWSGGSRAYRPNIPLTTNVDLYLLSTLFPNDPVLDVVTVWLIHGQTRVELANPPFSDLTNYYRRMTQQSSTPGGWARYGANQVFVATRSGTQYMTDWDLVVRSITMAADADEDPLDFPYTVPVPYYAAYAAKVNQRQYDEADTFLGYFQKSIRDIEGSRVGEMMAHFTYAKRGVA